MLTEFQNEAFTDFSDSHNQKLMTQALDLVKKKIGKDHPLVVGGERLSTEGADWLVSTNPAEPKQVIGRYAKATVEQADRAMKVALEAFEGWKRVPGHERARYLFKAAAMMRRKKFELSALLVLEIGKSWAEADGDVAEAIDFCDFYGREMLRLSAPQPLTASPGEENELHYIPMGVGIVIPPWNFPLAILVGMTTAAIVTGNTVVLKPSSETPGIAWAFFEILEEAGLPAGVLNFLPGPGASVGDFLISHPKTRFIAFTGSKEVGLRILELAAEGIVSSAFGFGGQKCSACSRAIIHKDVYDELLKKIKERTEKITLGAPENQKHYMGPVSSKSAYESIMEYVEIGKREGRVLTGGNAPKDKNGGFFIEPTVIADVSPTARISQEEIFGPVLALIKADGWRHAIEIANNTEFGLTGAVYSRNRRNLEQARHDFHVGNLYINRKCTGALVGVHPFGGFNMSGTDSKAGGRDYLLLFTQAKSIAEKY